MDFLEFAQNRYTTKKYDPGKKIPETQIEQLKEILRLTPSSVNGQPWNFIFVSEEKTKNELAAVSFFNEQKIKDASHLIVFAAIDDIAKLENEFLPKLPEGANAYYNRLIKPQGEAATRVWLQHQVYISLGFLLSGCMSMSIDSSPMEGIQKAEYDQILHLDGYKTLFAVAIGYRAADDANQSSITSKSRFPLEYVVKTI